MWSRLGKVSGTGLSNELPLYLLVIFVTFSPAVLYIYILYLQYDIRVVLHIFFIVVGFSPISRELPKCLFCYSCFLLVC